MCNYFQPMRVKSDLKAFGDNCLNVLLKQLSQVALETLLLQPISRGLYNILFISFDKRL